MTVKEHSFKVGDLLKHYKGSFYVVKGFALHTETMENLVLYSNIDNDAIVWARPKQMFFDDVIDPNTKKEVKRFHLAPKGKCIKYDVKPGENISS